MLLARLLLIVLVGWTIGLGATEWNLQDFETYAQEQPEFPKPDDNNWINPNFSSFFKKSAPSMFRQMLATLGLVSGQSLMYRNFKPLLAELNQSRASLRGRKVVRLRTQAPKRIFIVGDNHGAFHSLVRILRYLVEQQVFDEQLRIIAQDAYFVLNGDIINRSPYSVETLMLAMQLLKQNPERCFYIKGRHEERSYWKNFTLKDQLRLQTNALPNDEIPFADEIDSFFNTLPRALYITLVGQPYNTIRISHAERSDREINEQLMGNLFDDGQPDLTYYDLAKHQDTPSYITIPAIVKTEDWMREHRAYNGFGMLSQDDGATAWAVLSSPIQVHQEFYKMHWDVFALLTVNSPLRASTISPYVRDVNTNEAFKQGTVYNIFSARDIKKFGNKVFDDKNVFKIGSSMPLIKSASVMGINNMQGINVLVNEQNGNGGLQDLPIQLFIYNDDYIPFRMRQNITRLAQEGALIIDAPFGTAPVLACLDLFKKFGMFVFMPTSGSSLLRKADQTEIITARGGNDDEVRVLLDFLLTHYNAKKFAFFYQDDDYGIAARDLAHEYLKERGIMTWTDISYARGATDLRLQAAQIKQAQPDALGLFSVSEPSIELIRQIGLDNLTTSKLFGISGVAEDTFLSFIKRQGLDIVIASTVPNPATSKLEIAKDYRRLMDENGYTYNIYSFRTFIGTSLLFDAAQHLDLPLTPAKFLKHFESYKDYHFKGLVFTFAPQDRNLLHSLWVTTSLEGEWIERPIPLKTSPSSPEVAY